MYKLLMMMLLAVGSISCSPGHMVLTYGQTTEAEVVAVIGEPMIRSQEFMPDGASDGLVVCTWSCTKDVLVFKDGVLVEVRERPF